MWLDIDMRLRQRTNGTRGLDDFARALFAAKPGDLTIYRFEDVCSPLTQLAAYDWPGVLAHHLDAHDDTHLIDGLARGGALAHLPTRHARDLGRSTGGLWTVPIGG